MTDSSSKRHMAWNLDLPIGLTLQVQLKNERSRFKSQYLGMKPDEFLIIQMPGIPSVREAIMLRNVTLVVRFLIRGRVFGFESSVIGHVLKPSPMFFTTFPTSIESMNLRSTERVETFIEAEGVIQDQIVRGVILDLSAGGCRYTIDRSTGTRWPTMEPGDILRLRFDLGPNQGRVALDAEIVNAHTQVDKIRMGLKFLFEEDDFDLREAIDRYVKNISTFVHGQAP